MKLVVMLVNYSFICENRLHADYELFLQFEPTGFFFRILIRQRTSFFCKRDYINFLAIKRAKVDEGFV